MKVLLIGKGAREHAIAKELVKSSDLTKLYVMPYNPGIKKIAEIVDIDVKDFKKIKEFVIENNIELVVIGPEEPLVNGITDYLIDVVKVFGPNKEASKLEGSKNFSKDFMKKHSIPTAEYRIADTKEKAINITEELGYPIVYKIDGLAQGKGVMIIENEKESIEALKKIYDDNYFNQNILVIEEFLKGTEASLFVLIDKKTYKYFNIAKDYKRAYDLDFGPNTGGMGSVCPLKDLSDKENKEIDDIIEKTFNGIKADGIEYNGILFIGLIRTAKGVKVIEYNVRFGDPETQSMLSLLKTDLLTVMNKCANDDLENLIINWDNKMSVCLTIASKNYPLAPQKGDLIEINQKGFNKNVYPLYAGVKGDKEIYTDGGRVFSIVAKHRFLNKCIEMVYNAAENIKFEGMWYRKDIGL